MDLPFAEDIFENLASFEEMEIFCRDLSFEVREEIFQRLVSRCLLINFRNIYHQILLNKRDAKHLRKHGRAMPETIILFQDELKKEEVELPLNVDSLQDDLLISAISVRYLKYNFTRDMVPLDLETITYFPHFRTLISKEVKCLAETFLGRGNVTSSVERLILRLRDRNPVIFQNGLFPTSMSMLNKDIERS